MKGKRYTTEEKIRILREADAGKSILEVCKEHNLCEVSFHRWKKQFGQLEVNDARRLKELERENTELKKMLAESLLKNRVSEAVCEKNCKPGAPTELALTMVAAGGYLTGMPPAVSCGCRGQRTGIAVNCRPRLKSNCKSGCGSCRRHIPAMGIGGSRRCCAKKGWRVGKRQVQRLRRAEGLRVPPTKRRLVRRGVSTGWDRSKPRIAVTSGPGTSLRMRQYGVVRCGC